MVTHERRRVQPSADARNRALRVALDGTGRPLHVDQLAERPATTGERMLETAEHGRRLERERLSLHHDRPPRLADADPIDYDSASNAVASRAAAAGGRLDATGFEDVLARLSTERRADDDGAGVIEGRQSVVEHGRKLADEAEVELFCTDAGEELLEDECLRHAEAAIERGVDVNVGSRDADVRALARDHLPEATTWEPMRGWMDSPWGCPPRGRLVLVDHQRPDIRRQLPTER